MTYLKTTQDFYRQAAETPDAGLCCTTTPVWTLPGLVMPDRMLEMNYGCGSTVHPRDLVREPTILYVGVGGGMELLQFAYFSRQDGGVIGVDPVAQMRTACDRNLREAEDLNDWFSRDFVDLRDGDALSLSIDDESVDVAAQNCLFNIFEPADLERALAEMHRVLRPGGRFVLSDPVAPHVLPEHLTRDERLRAMCISGAITYERYVEMLVAAGFGTLEIRARRPYRLLDPERYGVDAPILLHSLEVAAIKDPVPADGACVFTGRTAIYFGGEESFDDGAGHVLARDMPLAVCDKTAAALEALQRPDLLVTGSTWFYDGGGCC
ncbi:MAG: methyltransferase domain-containing protein [Gemmatimonadetes bacterium]|nr:methyltransferase domain-containing protein [Gemmatimonadota bacterium]